MKPEQMSEWERRGCGARRYTQSLRIRS